MESLLIVFIVLAPTSCICAYGDGQAGYSGKKYDRTPKLQVFTELPLNRPSIPLVYPNEQQYQQHAQVERNYIQNSGLGGPYRQPSIHQRPYANFNTKQYNFIHAANQGQRFVQHSSYPQGKQLSANSYYLKPPPPPAPPTRMQQQPYLPQQYGYNYYNQSACSSSSSSLSNPYSPKYISQSEAAQLDAPFKHINGSTRPFTRIIRICDPSGQCKSQDSTDCHSGGTDFHHQQVLKLSRAQIQPVANTFENKDYYKVVSDALTGQRAKQHLCIPIHRGTDLKQRRMFAYSEIVIPQYPHN